MKKKDLPDKELIALYNIICAWEKPEIEKSRRFYSETIDDIIENNKYVILSKIKDDTIREEYLKIISKKEAVEKTEIANDVSPSYYSHTPNEVEKLLEEQIANCGLDQNGENMLATFLSSEDESNSRRMLEKIDGIIQEDKRQTFVQKYILPYIKQNMKYGFRGDGHDVLMEKNYNYITRDEYFELMQQSFARIEEGTDWVYSVVDDIEKLALWLYKKYSFEDLLSIFAKKLNMHLTWITACFEFTINFYEINYDESIKTLEDFREKYIGR